MDAAKGADVVAVDGYGKLVDGLALLDGGGDGQNNAFIYAELFHGLAQAVHRASGVSVIGLVLNPQEASLQNLDSLRCNLAGGKCECERRLAWGHFLYNKKFFCLISILVHYTGFAEICR